ncbi:MULTISPECIES: hypothetical protein [Haloglomus]|uniref:DUF7845 domain-containing protein n=1 Tax=Haloglomus TaxID=2806252 RepID=UPI0020C9D205|nr:MULTISPECIES: hypothetical protein [Haloglomus]
MSSDSVSGSVRPTGARHQTDRVEGIETVPTKGPTPARHGGGGKLVLCDQHRDADAVPFEVGEYRTLPDGSLYQWCRAAWVAHDDALVEDHKGRQYAVLSRSFTRPDDDSEYAVTLKSSRWKAGTGEGEDYSAWWKYDLTVQPLDEDGAVDFERTPDQSLTLKIEPQYDDLVYPDGNDLDLPHGEGSVVRVSSTWVDEPEEMLERAARLLGHALGYQLDHDDVVQDSLGFSKAEVHVRFDEDREGDAVHTLQQSSDLLTAHHGDHEWLKKVEDGCVLKGKIPATDCWEQLGFPDLDADILLKVYYPDHKEALDYPMDQPKMEVALAGKERVQQEDGSTYRRMFSWDRWDEVIAILEEILLSHLEWAGIERGDLVADDYFDGPEADVLAFDMPAGRRHWLQKHYQSLVPALYREATHTHTDLVYDILDVVRRKESVTYHGLAEETGAAYRTVREHVRKLAEEIGGDDPGILERHRGAVTVITFSSRYFEEQADDALDQIKPDDQPEDRKERAEERRERRESDDQADENEDTASSNVWEYFADLDLTADQLASALDQEYLSDQHVRVRVDDSSLFPTYGPPG